MKKGCAGCLMAIGAFFVIIIFILGIGQTLNEQETKEAANEPLYENTEYVESLAEDLIKQRLKDPDSYQFIDMNEMQTSKQGEKLFIVKYRAKNGFGGYNICQAMFSCDKDELTFIANED